MKKQKILRGEKEKPKETKIICLIKNSTKCSLEAHQTQEWNRGTEGKLQQRVRKYKKEPSIIKNYKKYNN